MKRILIIGLIFLLLLLSGCGQMSEAEKYAHHECYNICKEKEFETYQLEKRCVNYWCDYTCKCLTTLTNCDSDEGKYIEYCG